MISVKTVPPLNNLFLNHIQLVFDGYGKLILQPFIVCEMIIIVFYHSLKKNGRIYGRKSN